MRHGRVVVREDVVWRKDRREHERDDGMECIDIGRMRRRGCVERAMLFETRVTSWPTRKEPATYVSDGLQTFEGWDDIWELRHGVFYYFGSQDERRVVLWMVDELGDGILELQVGVFSDTGTCKERDVRGRRGNLRNR
jgi:hypothetical protein